MAVVLRLVAIKYLLYPDTIVGVVEPTTKSTSAVVVPRPSNQLRLFWLIVIIPPLDFKRNGEKELWLFCA